MRDDDGTGGFRARGSSKGRDAHLQGVLDDVEQQADGLALNERDDEVAELSRAEHAQVSLDQRLRGSVGRRLQVTVVGVGPVEGALEETGDGWLLLADGAGEWLVTTTAVTGVSGLGDRLPSASRSVAEGLGVASAMRRVAQRRTEVVLHRLDGTVLRGVAERVGADFVELSTGVAGRPAAVPLWALAAVRTAPGDRW